VAGQKLYRFWEYTFADDVQYQSLQYQRGEAFLIEPDKARLTVDELLRSHFEHPRKHSGYWDVPQADTFARVAELPMLIEQGIDTSAKVALHYQFDPRQSSYYRQAAEFLGLVTFGRGGPPGRPSVVSARPAVAPYRESTRYILTDLGREYVNRPADERRQLLAGILANFPPMRAVLELSAKAGTRGVSRKQIAELIERHSDIHKTTPARRASTLLAWLHWLQSATGAVEVSQTGFTLR